MIGFLPRMFAASGNGLRPGGPSAAHGNSRHQPKTTPGKRWAHLAVLVVLLSAVAVGCRTTADPESDSQASVVIGGKTTDDIRRAAVEVFTGEHYQAKASASRELVFERKGGALSNVLYGGWPGADQALWERVRIAIRPAGPDTCRLECTGYLVSYHGEGFFEEERKVSRTRAAGYRKLLARIKDQLQ